VSVEVSAEPAADVRGLGRQVRPLGGVRLQVVEFFAAGPGVADEFMPSLDDGAQFGAGCTLQEDGACVGFGGCCSLPSRKGKEAGALTFAVGLGADGVEESGGEVEMAAFKM
jgi:hypothetical protein